VRGETQESRNNLGILKGPAPTYFKAGWGRIKRRKKDALYPLSGEKTRGSEGIGLVKHIGRGKEVCITSYAKLRGGGSPLGTLKKEAQSRNQAD